MKVVEFNRGADQACLQASLEIVDKLRLALLEGRIIAFAGVGVTLDDQTESWSAATMSVSRLRMMGAVSHLLHCMHSGDA